MKEGLGAARIYHGLQHHQLVFLVLFHLPSLPGMEQAGTFVISADFEELSAGS